jgi:hypothetical protein
MAIGDPAWCIRAALASPPFYSDRDARALALKLSARRLYERGYPLRLSDAFNPPELSSWMTDRLEFFAHALGRLERTDPLAYEAIVRYDLPATWPRGGRWCRALACSFEEAQQAAWRGWTAMAEWVSD